MRKKVIYVMVPYQSGVTQPGGNGQGPTKNVLTAGRVFKRPKAEEPLGAQKTFLEGLHANAAKRIYWRDVVGKESASIPEERDRARNVGVGKDSSKGGVAT